MKTLEEFINEGLILEYIIGKNNKNKIKFNLTDHGDGRKSDRNDSNNRFTPNYEISYSLYKLSEQIRDDFDLNIIKEHDTIGLCDKSRNVHFNIVAELIVDNDFIILNIITHEYKNNFIFNDCKKIYTTYYSDKNVEKEYKPLNRI